LVFSDRINDYNNEIYNLNTSEVSQNIEILKRVKSIRYLKNTEKEFVRLCYKEAILKGFSLVNHIQCYIASKTKIWIERSGLEYLKKSEEEEDRKWYFNLAKDHFAYIGVYRRTIDELEQCKKELWSMMMTNDTTHTEKIQIIKELHNLTKTHILLLRDLPFVTNLSKYYDLDLINSNSQKTSPINSIENTKVEKEIIEQKVSERLRKMVNESALFNSEQKRKMGIISPPLVNRDRNIDDEIMDEMQKQLNCNPEDILESINNKDYQESIQRLKDIRED
jgi:DNA-binding Xre family transcriptional regulator